MSKIIPGMTKIIEGIRVFQDQVFDTKAELFEKLDKGQNPPILFVTCSDSRINPNLLTQTDPGELFILRNAGNIVPPYGSGGGEEATIEYAVAALKVRHIVICGHSSCGAMHGLLEPKAVTGLPGVARWLSHARGAAAKAKEGISPRERLQRTIENNVLLQREHLRSHPSVIAALERGEIKLHAWVYDFATGDVSAHDPAREEFTPLDLRRPAGREEVQDRQPQNCM